MRNRNALTSFLTFVLASAIAMPFLTSTRNVSANLTGAIYTTDKAGSAVNANIFEDCCDVCLNGGPKNCSSGSGLPDGDYYFQVTDPSGATLLSNDDISERKFHVTAGFMTAYLGASGPGAAGSCTHEVGTGFCAAQNAICIQLMPFAMTPNNGGEYKVWITPVSEYDPSKATSSKDNWGFVGDTKTDNFKCKMHGTTPQSAIGGVKYYDTNANGMLDPGEQGIEGVEIDVTIGNDPPIQTFTDATGTWALVFDVGTQYKVCEVLPNNTTYTQTGPKQGAQTADGAATANSSMCWEGTVLATGTFDLNFFNVTCIPQITCPNDISTCNAEGVCSAVVTYTTPTATDNCGGNPQVACEPPSGSVFPKGSTTVTCTATDPHDQTAHCTFQVKVSDCQSPTIQCPVNKTVCNDAGKCSAVVNFTATANDNCDGSLTPTCSPASGSTFVMGTTTVNCSVSDAAGNPASCSFTVTVNDCTTGTISGKKFYDANANGADDDGKVVTGWKVVLSGSASATKYTNGSGAYSFGPLPVGTYTVTEVSPNGSWVASSGAPCTFTISCSNASNAFTCNFGNYCKVPSGGLTLGFWSNKNGQAQITAADLCALTSLHLRTASGGDFDPVPASSCPALTAKQISDGKTALNNWILSANASNMANMLSAQFAAMTLNVRHGFVDGNAFDLCSGLTINQLLAAAEASLTTNPNTTASGAVRTYQEKLKSCIDALNNNGLDVKSTSCSFTSPY